MVKTFLCFFLGGGGGGGHMALGLCSSTAEVSGVGLKEFYCT